MLGFFKLFFICFFSLFFCYDKRWCSKWLNPFLFPFLFNFTPERADPEHLYLYLLQQERSFWKHSLLRRYFYWMCLLRWMPKAVCLLPGLWWSHMASFKVSVEWQGLIWGISMCDPEPQLEDWLDVHHIIEDNYLFARIYIFLLGNYHRIIEW